MQQCQAFLLVFKIKLFSCYQILLGVQWLTIPLASIYHFQIWSAWTKIKSFKNRRLHTMSEEFGNSLFWAWVAVSWSQVFIRFRDSQLHMFLGGYKIYIPSSQFFFYNVGPVSVWRFKKISIKNERFFFRVLLQISHC